jgi:hypothetical protein
MTHGSERIRLEGRAFDSCGSGQGQMASACEHRNEPLGSLKFREFLEYVWKY